MILITGGFGFIGAHTVRALLELDQPCVVVQRSERPVPEFLAGYGGDLAVERADCADLGDMLRIGERRKITGIVHLAAAGMTHGTPLDNLQENVHAFFTILRAARQWGTGRVVQASTIGVYAGIDAAAFREDAPLPMTSAHVLQAYKKSAEIFAGAVGAEGLEVVSARIGAIWGPLGRERSPFFGAPQLIHAAVRGASGPADPPPHADDGIDMCYVRDCGLAIAMLQVNEKLNHQVYNVGSGRIITNQEVAAALIRVVPGAAPALTGGRSPGAPASDARLDIERLCADTGFRPRYDLDAAVGDYVGWLRAGHER